MRGLFREERHAFKFSEADMIAHTMAPEQESIFLFNFTIASGKESILLFDLTAYTRDQSTCNLHDN